jgi:Phasin protein
VHRNILYSREVEMSEEKQAKVRRTPAPKPAAEPAVSATPEVEAAPAAALPAPDPVPALPALISRRQEAGADKLLNACHATLASICASQTAIASDVTAMAPEIGGLTRSNLTTAGESVTALLGSQNLVDAFEIQLGFARHSLDAMVGGSTKLAELGLRLANDAAKPMLRPFVAG